MPEERRVLLPDSPVKPSGQNIVLGRKKTRRVLQAHDSLFIVLPPHVLVCPQSSSVPGSQWQSGFIWCLFRPLECLVFEKMSDGDTQSKLKTLRCVCVCVCAQILLFWSCCYLIQFVSQFIGKYQFGFLLPFISFLLLAHPPTFCFSDNDGRRKRQGL
jgi:hypothetical protein